MVRTAEAVPPLRVVVGPASAGPPTREAVVRSAFVEEWKPAEAAVDRVAVSLGGGRLRACSADGEAVPFQPAGVGSREHPSAQGTKAMSAVVLDFDRTRRPHGSVQRGDLGATRLRPPGPDDPTESLWIDLAAPTCGIQGRPSRSKVDERPSRGCVRRTIRVAREIADLSPMGDTMAFVE